MLCSLRDSKSVPLLSLTFLLDTHRGCHTLMSHTDVRHWYHTLMSDTDVVRVISSIRWSQICGSRNYLYLVQNLQFSLKYSLRLELTQMQIVNYKATLFPFRLLPFSAKMSKIQVQWSVEQKVSFFFCQFSFIPVLYKTPLWKKIKQTYLI